MNELDGVDHTKLVNSNTEALTAEHVLLQRVENLRAALLREYDRRQALEQRVAATAAAATAAATAEAVETGTTAETAAAPDEPAITTEPDPSPPVPTVGRRRPREASSSVTATGAPIADSAGVVAEVTSPTPKARVFATAKRVLPPGSRARNTARAGLLAYRESRRVSRDVRRVLTATGVVEAREPSYHHWYKQHDVDEKQLTAQREASRSATEPLHVLVCVLVADDESRGGVKATVDSVRRQSWDHWTLVVCARPRRRAVCTRGSRAVASGRHGRYGRARRDRGVGRRFRRPARRR